MQEGISLYLISLKRGQPLHDIIWIGSFQSLLDALCFNRDQPLQSLSFTGISLLDTEHVICLNKRLAK